MGSWRPNPGAMNLEDPMATNMKPATPLPWRVTAVEPDRYPAYPIKSGSRLVALVHIRASGKADADADYIAKACNAYPKLVEALRTLIDADREGELCNDQFAAAIDILRELGEVQS